MATRTQIDRLMQRIEALGLRREDRPRLGVVFGEPGETEEAAWRRHAELYARRLTWPMDFVRIAAIRSGRASDLLQSVSCRRDLTGCATAARASS